MKRSFLTIAAMAVFSISACGDADNDAYIEPVDELTPPPPPAPAPAQPMDTMMPMDTLLGDTLRTTTTGM
ncbi:MAG: hypothetical protein KFH98_10640 [Gemmatimonadetes bacterium]|nr:hypothetical protein [Gemmatimonadota bacterium]